MALLSPPRNKLSSWLENKPIPGIAVLVALCFSLVIVLLFGIATAQNRNAIEQSASLLNGALNRNRSGQIRTSHAYAAWGAAYQHLHVKFDPSWAYDSNNIGEDVYNLFGIDYLFVISPDDRTLYSMIRGKISERNAESCLGEALAPLVIRARDSDPLNTRAAIDTVIDQGCAAEQNIPVTVTAEQITPGSDPKISTVSGPPTVLVIGKQITTQRLASLAEGTFAHDLRLVADSADPPAASLAFPLADGRMLRLAWTPEEPGTKLLASLMPWLVLAGTLLAVLTWLILRHSARTQALLTASAERLEAALAETTRVARHDQVTGLPNKYGLEIEIRRLNAEGGAIGLAFMDLDHFKTVNDSLGHATGDQVLAIVARRLAEAAPEGAVVARTGGDEFVMVAEATALTIACPRLIEAVSAPVPLTIGEVYLGLSIGITSSDSGPVSLDELLRQADIAMYQAKAEGRNRCRVFDPRMNDAVQSRRLLEIDLRAALARGEFILYFQPRFDTNSLTPRVIEALLRWQHPEWGLTGPGSFISVAEDTGLISEIGAWVLREACATVARWPGVGVSVNVSSMQLRRGDFPQLVREALTATGLHPDRLELELTESVLFEESEHNQAVLQELSDIGVRLALDDFGTGFSSLSYLLRFPFDALKIDRSFVIALEPEGDARAIIQAILALGHALSLAVIAEGVETAEQLELLRLDGCDEVQGFFLAKPMPPSALVKLLGPVHQPATALL